MRPTGPSVSPDRKKTMTAIIDFHTHAFPDQVARSAIPFLEAEADVRAKSDGTVSALLASMDRDGVEKSVICSIATRPAQFTAILAWSKEIASDRLIPFPSVHPADPQLLARVVEIKAAGFKGIKMHPYYQDFFLDDERLWPFYEKVCEAGLVLVMHTGFDIAFPRLRKAAPSQIARVLDRLPGLKLVATHLGAWEQWHEVEKFLVGRPLYMDISYSLPFMTREQARRIIKGHPADYLLFGTDSPWSSPAETRGQLRELGLGDGLEEKILRENGLRLLATT